MIDFSAKTLEEARSWPLLLRIVEEKVKPVRMHDKRATYKTYWWRPGESGAALYQALTKLTRCLVSANVTKHLLFSFQPTATFFSQMLYVFALDGDGAFAVLQSRIHEPWARLLSSSMKNDLRYAASDCFDTFPFPQHDPRTVIPSVQNVGARLYEARAKCMLDAQQGLTQTYNRLKDADCRDPAIVELRDLHEEMDRSVLDAYGWRDIEVPPYCPSTPVEQKAVEAFSDEIIDRLFVLNAQRAEQEIARGLGKPSSKQRGMRANAPKRATKALRREEQAELDLSGAKR